ncbi:MAG: hypothetical protein Q8O40_08335 [Chloroflexota bacterium]|nr:hypothetical protein [Chloroflexota bacterium]
MDRHILKLALMGMCGRPGVTDQARENIRHAAQAVGVYDDALESVIVVV